MTIVEMTTSSLLTAETERAVIAAARARWPTLCSNIGAGGEHASAGSPHFVYIVWFPSGMLRG